MDTLFFDVKLLERPKLIFFLLLRLHVVFKPQTLNPKPITRNPKTQT